MLKSPRLRKISSAATARGVQAQRRRGRIQGALQRRWHVGCRRGRPDVLPAVRRHQFGHLLPAHPVQGRVWVRFGAVHLGVHRHRRLIGMAVALELSPFLRDGCPHACTVFHNCRLGWNGCRQCVCVDSWTDHTATTMTRWCASTPLPAPVSADAGPRAIMCKGMGAQQFRHVDMRTALPVMRRWKGRAGRRRQARAEAVRSRAGVNRRVERSWNSTRRHRAAA